MRTLTSKKVYFMFLVNHSTLVAVKKKIFNEKSISKAFACRLNRKARWKWVEKISVEINNEM